MIEIFVYNWYHLSNQVKHLHVSPVLGCRDLICYYFYIRVIFKQVFFLWAHRLLVKCIPDPVTTRGELLRFRLYRICLSGLMVLWYIHMCAMHAETYSLWFWLYSYCKTIISLDHVQLSWTNQQGIRKHMHLLFGKCLELKWSVSKLITIKCDCVVID